MDAILRTFGQAPEPTKPAEVKKEAGERYRWVCRGCRTLVIGEPARRDGQSWYCTDCA